MPAMLPSTSRRPCSAMHVSTASLHASGLVTSAGLPGLTDRPGRLLVSVNYFGTIAMLEGLRPLLAKGTSPAAVAISSNSTTCQPGVPMDVVKLCLGGDEAAAGDAADVATSL